MSTDSTPFFMQNKEWFDFDYEKGAAILTKVGKANRKAVESYKSYYSQNDFLE